MEKRVIRNSTWLMIEKVISIMGAFFVSALVAKYVGPSLVGKISLAVASFQVIIVMAQFGSENVLIKRISRNIASGIFLAKLSFLIRTLVYISLSIPFLLYMHGGDSKEFLFFLSVGIAGFFSAIDVISTYNDTRLHSRKNTVINLYGLISSVGLRYLFVAIKADVLWLTIPIVTTTLIPFIIRVCAFYTSDINSKSAIPIHLIPVYVKYLLYTGGAIFISNISTVVYSRVSMFFISNMCSAELLGIYSVATTLATSWSFILISFIASNFPIIYNERSERLAVIKTGQLNLIIIGVSSVFILGAWLFGKSIIYHLYGSAFIRAWKPMLILCVATMLSTMGGVASRYIIKYAGYRYLSFKSLMVLILSIPCSYYAIRYYGLTGASYSVVAIELTSLTLFNYLFGRGVVFKMHAFTFYISLFRRSGRSVREGQ